MAYSEPTITPFNPFPTAIPNSNLLTADLINARPFRTAPLLFPLKPSTITSTRSLKSSPDSTPSLSLQEFTLFPDLPLELRLQIIRSTFPSRSHKNRLILTRPHSLASRTRLNSFTNIIHKKTEFLFSSPSLPPVALFINREARAEALRYYRLCFGFGDGDADLGGQMYFYCPPNSNPRAVRGENERGEGGGDGDGDAGDVLYFEFTGTPFYSNLGYFTATILGEGCTRLDMSLITRIGLSHRMIAGRPMALRKMVKRLDLFENLKEVIVVIERGVNDTSEENGSRSGIRQVRPVGREARLKELGEEGEWDEETRALVEEVEGARAIWGVLGWEARKQGDMKELPGLRVMEFENLEEWDGGRVVEDKELVVGESVGNEEQEEVAPKAKKDVRGQMAKILRRFHIGRSTEDSSS